MYDHRQPLSDEAVMALFQQHLPVAKIPPQVEKRLLSRVSVALADLKRNVLQTPTNHSSKSEIESTDCTCHPQPPAGTERLYYM